MPKPGFRIDLHIKDLNNALECAHSVGAPVPMTAQVSEIMQYLHNNGDVNIVREKYILTLTT